ncbi:MAG: amidinotransferase [Lewinellaceae bacterium]|nr:amidinotransferase [Saprospiraceae bacterium]MCB9345741.1 amidinotransferase [Lewinellaceae bacterium]
MRTQTTSHILMVRPANFGYNEQTAENNAFQLYDDSLSDKEIRVKALVEFDAFVECLKNEGVQVIVAEDSASPAKPDAVFPNNWVTFHQEGFVITYPMFAPIRREERSESIIEQVLQQGFNSTARLHFEASEENDQFLEGTGSVIFDHVNKIAYAGLSPRTNDVLLDSLCEKIGYEAVTFRALDAAGQEVYHTNVMMAMGENFVVVCLGCIWDQKERAMLENKFRETGKEIVNISLDQMNAFAGNMLQVKNKDGKLILVMSSTAYESLTPDQITLLEGHTSLLHCPIDTIETYGGGSARCMMAEVFLPKL